MSLRIIYGKSGTGKSTYIFNEIAEKIKENKKIYIITPEQYSFTAEKKLLNTIKEKAIINAEVLTFGRMAYRVLNEVGGVSKTHLTECGRAMLIYSILMKEKRNLKFLGKSDENTELLLTTLTEFKKHNINNEILAEMIVNTKEEYLKSKLKDVHTVFESYEAIIQGKYIDENDVLTLLSEKIEKTHEFDDSLIYIDEFVGFTPQEYSIIEKLFKIANQVTVTVCTDSLNQTDNKDMDLYYTNKITAQKLIDLAKLNNIKTEKNIKLENLYRFKSQELIHLEENIYAPFYSCYKDNVTNINLFLANNYYSEIENVAINILKLVKEENLRYKDISIITKNTDTYSSIAKAIFNKYQIPVFIDEKRELSQNILVKYLIALLEIFTKNWTFETVMNYIKIGLCDIDAEDIFILENYAIKWGINGNKWYSNENWSFGEVKDQAQLDKINMLRRKIVNPILKFRENINKDKNVENISSSIYNFLIENEIDKKLQEKMKLLLQDGNIDLSNEYKASWDIVIKILDEIVLVFKDEKMSFDKYIQILKIGIKNSSLGKIPVSADQVIMGDIDRSRSHKVKAVFIIGINDGVFPSKNNAEGFFNDKDREKLQSDGIEMAKTTLDRLYEDKFNIYKAFTTAEEKVFLSYASSDNEGKSLRQSMIITRVKKMFPNLKEDSDVIQRKSEITNEIATFDELINKLRDLSNGEQIEDIWYEIYNYYANNKEWKERLESSLKGLNYTNLAQKINNYNIKNLYGEKLNTSVSKLERYRSCPFSFHLQYGLNIKERDELKVKSLDTGTFMHDTIDEFFNSVLEQGKRVKELEEDEVNEIIDQIIDNKLMLNKNYIFSSSAKYKLLAIRLKRVVKKSMKYILQTLTKGEFDVMANELEFKDNSKYKPILLELDDGRKVELTGKIDRIDIAQNEDGKYIRIIDYKSSVKSIDLNSVMAGLQIQLLTYLDAVVKIEDMLPAGVLYFNLIDPIVKASKRLTDDEIEEEIRKNFKMNGLILADVKTVKLMDRDLNKGASKVVPAYIDSSGSLSASRSNAITRKQFDNLQKYMYKLIKDISSEIMNGNIDIKPYYKNKKTPCEFCAYKSICNFKNGFCNNKYNYIPEKDKQEILNEIEEKVQEDS